MSEDPVNILGSFNIITKSSNQFIIAGYASWNVVDIQRDKISPAVIGPAFDKMMSIPERRNLMLNHSNIQIGRILPSYTDKTGRVWKSGSDSSGLFIIAEIFNDISITKKIKDLMLKGLFLSYSIGGTALKRARECTTTGGKQSCYSNVEEMELHEITLCERGANQYAKGFILEKDIEKQLDNMLNTNDLPQSNDTFKYNIIKPINEDILMSETLKKSDLQLVLDAVEALKKDLAVPVAAVPTPPAPQVVESAPKTLTEERVREIFAESVKIPEPKPADPVIQVKEVPVEVVKYVYEKPDETKFKSKEEYNKVLADYEAFRKAVLEEAKKELGPVITKKAPDTKDSAVDVEAIFNKAIAVDDFESLLNEVK